MRKRSDLPFKILDLVEISAPVLEALPTGPTTQADRVAQPFSQTAQVPCATVVPTVVVAGRATHVRIARQPGVTGIVEELLARQHHGRELLDGDRVDGCRCSHAELAIPYQPRQIEDPQSPIHEVVDIQGQAVGRDGDPIGCAPRIEAEQFDFPDRIDHRDVTARLQRDEQVRPCRVETAALARLELS
ncbi:hypothetical protein Y694_04265 [Methylibium sp. T29-B]|nr:hypothetical protein Y694_04265 [Methylibium sp. T29-B]